MSVGRFGDDITDHDAEYVRLTFQICSARAVAYGGDLHGGLGAKGVAESSDDSRAGGRDQFFEDAIRIGGLAH